MIKFKRFAEALHYPVQCVLCGSRHRQAESLCGNCILLLPEIKAYCGYCAIPLWEGSNNICGQCLQTKPLFSAAFAQFPYVLPIKELLHRYKYRYHLYLATLFSHLMKTNPPPFIQEIDAFIPVPVHSGKLRERGFNPVAIFTRQLAKYFRRPCLLHYCQKIRPTPAQAGLKKNQRQNNLKNSFQCKPLNNQRIVLIDDLMTTGSTVTEVTRVLLQAGAPEVYVWCLARAGIEEQQD